MEFQFVPVTALTPSPLNPRKTFREDRLAELAATMGDGVGVIEPLVVRAIRGGRYEIVAGERRWRAAQIAGLTDVPVVIKVLTDAQVLEIQVIENHARADMNALEEADGLQRLLNFGMPIDTLAQRLGKSRKYVYDRVKLLDLVPDAQTLLRTGRITPGHAILLARLDEAQQQTAIAIDRTVGAYGQREFPLFEREAVRRDEDLLGDPDVAEAPAADLDRAGDDPYDGLKAKSVREFEAWIAEHCRFAPAAPVNVALFPEVAAAVEEAERVVHITHDHHVHPDAKDGTRTYGPLSWKRVDPDAPCDHSVLGVIVVGPGRGQAFRVCTDKDRCDTHWRKERRAKAKAAKAPQQQAGAKTGAKVPSWEVEHRKREEEAKTEAAAWSAAAVPIAAACCRVIQARPLEQVVSIILEFPGSPDRAAVAAARSQLGGGGDADTWLRALALAVVEGARAEGERGFNSYDRARFAKLARKVLGVDVKAILDKGEAPVTPPATAAAKAKAPVKVKATPKQASAKKAAAKVKATPKQASAKKAAAKVKATPKQASAKKPQARDWDGVISRQTGRKPDGRLIEGDTAWRSVEAD